MSDRSIFDSEDSFQKSLLDRFEEGDDWNVVRDSYFREDIVREFNEFYVRDDSEVILEGLLKQKLIDINSGVDFSNVDRFYNEVLSAFNDGSSLSERNRSLCKLLRSGSAVKIGEDTVSFDVFDFDDLDNNDFVVFEEFNVEGSGYDRRPDLVFMVNGLPLVVVELKNVIGGSQTNFTKGISELEGVYQDEVSDLFVSNVFCVAADQLEVQYGSIGCGVENYHSWGSSGGEDIVDRFVSLVDPGFVLDVLDRFIFHIVDDGSISKIVPMRHQYEAVNCIVDDFLESEDLGLYRSHLISHVQGSGKSYTMLYASKILYSFYNCQIFLVVDKNNLEEQFLDELNNIDEIMFCNKAESGEHLEGLVESGKPEIILTTIQKFGSIDHSSVSSPEGSCQVVFADEAHRFQSADLGSYMDAAFDNYHYYGFTGTPTDDAIEVFSKDRDDNYLHSYSMGEAIDDGSILKVNVEERPVFFDFDYDSMNSYFENHTEGFSEVEKKRLIDSVSREDIESVSTRIGAIVKDIVEHYIGNVRDKNMKGMVVTSSRKKASRYGYFLKELFSSRSDLDEEEVGVLFSDYNKKDSSSDELVQRFGKSKKEAIDVRENFGDSDKNPKIVVVCDMLLTGFDAPILKTVYLDRNFEEGHNLLQTIARTNRTRDNKKFGEIIDYCGVTQNFDDMIEYNTEEIEKFKTKDKKDFVEEFEDKILQIREYYFSDKVTSLLNDDSIDSHNNVEKFLNELDSVVKQGNFVEEFEELRTLYENLRPHKTIAKYNKEYKLYEKIYQVYSNSVEESKNKAVIKDNKDIIEKAIEKHSKSRVEDTVREFEIKGLGSNNSVKVTEKYVEVKEFMRNNKEKLPKYKELSERIKELVESEWDSNEISNEKAIGELEEIYDKVEEKKVRFENSDLSPSQEIFRSIIESKADNMSNSKIKDKAISIEKYLSQQGYDNLSRFSENDIDKLKSDLIDILRKEKCLRLFKPDDINKMVDKYIGTN